uniref:DNA-directed RNA polymerase subunit alpha C-terminal domain-containing protein n=1 Tax=Morganella morganii TaxID=582 RepID=UPI00301D7A58
MSYITTITGKHIDFANITPDQFCIKDIAAGLSNTCRFTGQLANFYSVAQHSVYVSQIVPPEYALEALLHDATEAYMGDITSPLKAMLPDYKAIEKCVDAAIRERFCLPPVMTIDVHRADLVMLATERRDFEISPSCGFPELSTIDPHDDIIIHTLTPPQAYRQFMTRFEVLTKGDSFPQFFELDLSVKAVNRLEQAGIITTGLLLRETEISLLRIPGIGSKVLKEIIESIEPFGLRLKRG